MKSREKSTEECMYDLAEAWKNIEECYVKTAKNILILYTKAINDIIKILNQANINKEE